MPDRPENVNRTRQAMRDRDAADHPQKLQNPETRRAENVRPEPNANSSKAGTEQPPATAEQLDTEKEPVRDRLEFPELRGDDWKEIHNRQEGRCALSGDPLNETAELHHVVPAKHNGVRNEETNSFVTDYRRNGVLVNRQYDLDHGESMDEASPHLAAHGGNYNNGAAMPHSSFKYSHGSNRQAHEQWAQKNGQFADQKIWGENSVARQSAQKQNAAVQPTSQGQQKPQKVPEQYSSRLKGSAKSDDTRSNAFGKSETDRTSSKKKLTAENTRKYRSQLTRTSQQKKTIKQ